MKFKLPKLKNIIASINKLFSKIEYRLLGRFAKKPPADNTIIRDVEPAQTLESLYNASIIFTTGTVPRDDENLKILTEITANYLEAEKLKRINKLVNDLKSAKSKDEAKLKVLKNFKETLSYLNTLVTTESRNVQAHADREGVSLLAADVGVEDPIIVKLGVVDNRICNACKLLWHSPSNLSKPRPWKLSELADGYNKDMKNPIPTINATHPNCRHVMTFVPPNYGFTDGGQLKFMFLGYNYYDDYYAVHKNESFDIALECECSELVKKE